MQWIGVRMGRRWEVGERTKRFVYGDIKQIEKQLQMISELLLRQDFECTGRWR